MMTYIYDDKFCYRLKQKMITMEEGGKTIFNKLI